MKHYLLAMGGAGSRVLESVIWSACAGTLCSTDGQPVRQLHMLLMDTDKLNDRAVRLREQISRAESIRAAMPEGSRVFRTEMELTEWKLDLTGQEERMRSMAGASQQDQLLLKALFPKEDAAMQLSRGLDGHADMGMLLLAGALAQSGQSDHPLYGMLEEIGSSLEAGEDVRVMLVGAAFGATGSSGVCMLARHLRRRFDAYGDHLQLAALMLTPYEKHPEDYEADLRTRAALENMAVSGMLDSDDNRGVLDGLWVLGAPEGCRTAAVAHDAHLMLWLAACCVSDCFMKDAAGLRGAHYWQTPDEGFTWTSFGEQGELIRSRFGAMLRMTALFQCELEPVLSDKLEDGAALLHKKWYAAHFASIRRASDEEKQREQALLTTLMSCLNGFTRWLCQLVACMPVQYRNSAEYVQLIRRAAEHYRKVMDKAGRIYLLEEEIQRSGMEEEQVVMRTSSQMTMADEMLQLTEEKYEELGALSAEQAALDRRIGGGSKHRIMKRMLRGLERALSDMGARAAENRRILEEANRILSDTPEEIRLRDDREALFHLEAHLQLLRAERITLCNELQAWEKKQQHVTGPEVPAHERTIPACDLFDGAQLLRMMALSEPVEDKKQRAQLQKEIEEHYGSAVLPQEQTAMRDDLAALGKMKTIENHASPLGAFIACVAMITGKEAEA